MALPAPVNALWDELTAARAEVLREVEGLSQHQADWKPGEQDWSVGEIVHHVTIAEIATSKLTTKLAREAEAARALVPFPPELTAFEPLPPWPPGPQEAPPIVWPQHGKPIGELLDAIAATRERSRASIETMATLDPRRLRFKHVRLGELDLAQWWALQARHDRLHLAQIRDVKASPRFPRG